MQYRVIALGGTFDIIHIGHIELLKKGFSISEKVIIGLTSDVRTVGQLSLSWGTESIHLSEGGDIDSRIDAALRLVRDGLGLEEGQLVAVLAGTNANARATNVLRVEQIPFS